MKLIISISLLCLVFGQTTISVQLLQLLQEIHGSGYFQSFLPEDKTFTEELLVATKARRVAQFIVKHSYSKLFTFDHHLKQLRPNEGEQLALLLKQEVDQEINIRYLGRRSQAKRGHRDDLSTILHRLRSNSAYGNLADVDKALMNQLIEAAHNGTVTPLIHNVGYIRVIQLVEHISTTSETHTFLSYLVSHMEQESHALFGRQV